MKSETLQQTPKKFRDYQDILLKKFTFHEIGKFKRNEGIFSYFCYKNTKSR